MNEADFENLPEQTSQFVRRLSELGVNQRPKLSTFQRPKLSSLAIFPGTACGVAANGACEFGQ